MTIHAPLSASDAALAASMLAMGIAARSASAQIAKADSTIASLESQVSYVTGLFAAYNGTSSTSTSNGLSTL